jgi:hypothetical protein
MEEKNKNKNKRKIKSIGAGKKTIVSRICLKQ